jgi:hypothetical protein
MLLDYANYIAPDGRLFKARMENHHGPDIAWTFTPPGNEDAANRIPTRDALSKLLFYQHGKIVFLDFSGLSVKVCDTGWTIDDFKPG